MTNKARSLDDIPIAYMMDDSWVWKDDMIVFPRDDGFYDDDDLEYEATWYDDGSAERLIAELEAEAHGMIWGYNATQNELDFDDHPIVGEFPHDSIVAPRGWDKVD